MAKKKRPMTGAERTAKYRARLAKARSSDPAPAALDWIVTDEDMARLRVTDEDMARLRVK